MTPIVNWMEYSFLHKKRITAVKVLGQRYGTFFFFFAFNRVVIRLKKTFVRTDVQAKSGFRAGTQYLRFPLDYFTCYIINFSFAEFSLAGGE